MDKVIPVKVAIRIRPLVPREIADACNECLRTVNGEPQVSLGKDKSFTYDYVFPKTSPQIEVYETAVQPLLSTLFKGYNTTVLAYGQTGSGKTHTMGSGQLTLCTATASANTGVQELNLNDNDEVGVIPRVLNDLFRKIEEEQTHNKDAKFTVKVSFVEVYNEEIKDLFNLKPANGATAEPLNIREENNEIKVTNLSEITVTSALTTIQLLEKGSSIRVVGGTAMNDQSSRSHAIFTITLEQVKGSDNKDLIKSKFHLVDLAGSERQSKTKAEGLRLKEGININLGLLALGNVISVLGEDNPTNKVKHVPYRESKLTRLLQDSLGGNSHTLMIACVSPADSNMEETLNSLRYADRARKIKNKPIINIDPQAAELSSLRQQVQDLKAQLLKISGGMNQSIPSCFGNSNSFELSQLQEENEKLKIDNAKLVSDLQRSIHINRINYEKMSQLENEKEEQKRKFLEIKQTLEKLTQEEQSASALSGVSPNKTIDVNNTSQLQNNTCNKTLISELRFKLGEFEQLGEKEQHLNMMDNEEDSSANEPADKDYALRQAQMQFQLTEFDSELMKKQYIHQKMLENLKQSNKENVLDAANVSELKQRIESLEKEKEDLQELIRSSDRKQAEQKRDRLKQLESEVLELKRKEKDAIKIMKLKEENEKNCEKLRMEIIQIKNDRVKLIKQMKADTDSFRKYKQVKEKEVTQLKALERKRLVEINRLQEGNSRQEAVLKRKNEEINRIQKQLRETAEKQKLVAEKRQQTFDRKESSLGEKLRSWLTNEIELSVNLAEARVNLNKLIEERKESAAELARLNEKLNEMNNDAADFLHTGSKQRKYLTSEIDSTYIALPSVTPPIVSGSANEEEESRQSLEQMIERIKEDIECKNIQINEIQQTVIEGDQDDKAKHLFKNIHGLLEAKVMLKHLYNSSVQYLFDLKTKQIQYEINMSSLTSENYELKKKNESVEDELKKNTRMHNNEKNQLIQHYEQRILQLLKTLSDDPSIKTDDRYNIMIEQLHAFERKIDKEPGSSDDSRKFSKFGLIGNKEDYKKAQKLKRDHRRTRVIRTTPLDEEEEENQLKQSRMKNLLIDTINEQSPAQSPFVDDDDKIKDPDWGSTPVIIRTRAKPAPGKKPTGLTKRNSRSKLAVTAEFEQVASNDENKEPTNA